MIKLPQKDKINIMNCLILRRIENSVLNSGTDNQSCFTDLPSVHLTFNKWNAVENTLCSNMI